MKTKRVIQKTKENKMKKKILFAGITGMMLVFGFVLAGCDNGTGDGGGGDAIGSVYQGTYTGTNTSKGTLTVGKDSISGDAVGGELTGVRTSGGGSDKDSNTGTKFTWTYVYKDNTKIGLVLAADGESTIGLGTDVGMVALALYVLGALPDTEGMDETHSFYGETNP
jgi:hypothetical protein